MPTVRLPLVLIAVLSASCCLAQSATSSSGAKSTTPSSSSIQIGEIESTATLRGHVGVADILGDKVEHKDGAVFVNGTSFGAVSDASEIKYVVTKSGCALYVDGVVRMRAATKCARLPTAAPTSRS